MLRTTINGQCRDRVSCSKRVVLKNIVAFQAYWRDGIVLTCSIVRELCYKSRDVASISRLPRGVLTPYLGLGLLPQMSQSRSHPRSNWQTPRSHLGVAHIAVYDRHLLTYAWCRKDCSMLGVSPIHPTICITLCVLLPFTFMLQCLPFL